MCYLKAGVWILVQSLSVQKSLVSFTKYPTWVGLDTRAAGAPGLCNWGGKWHQDPLGPPGDDGSGRLIAFGVLWRQLLAVAAS